MEQTWELKLYIAGKTVKSETALRNLKRYCREHLEGRYKIEVIDLLKKPPKLTITGFGRLNTFVRMKGLEPPRHEDTRS